jgi:hypothetical protein
MRIYVASSWRNGYQQSVVDGLRSDSHEVYDFRHPEAQNYGFAWSAIDPKWQEWSTKQFVQALEHPTACYGFDLDMQALTFCDACILVLPCGRSAHLELGHANGMGKLTYVYVPPGVQTEPELMYKMCNFVTDNFRELRLQLDIQQSIMQKGFYLAPVSDNE